MEEKIPIEEKKQPIKLDSKDWKILYELDKDSRQPYSEIAKKLGLSKDVVIYRIKHLKDRGIIKTFFTIVDASRIGYLNIRVYLKLQDVSVELKQELINFLVDNKSTWFVAGVEGQWDIDFIMWVKDMYQFDSFWSEFLLKYRKYIANKLISIHTRVYHLARGFIGKKKINDTQPRVFGTKDVTKIDELDLKILKLLSTNSRISSLEISKQLGVSAKVVGYRIKNLIKDRVVVGFSILLNLKLLNYEYYKIDFDLSDVSKKNQLLQYALQHPNTIYIDEAIGGWDFELEIQVISHLEFRKVIEDMEEKFGNIIRNYTYFLFHDVYKTIYMPLE